ncbi:hypothetical protein HK407_08g12800 [Ordospora pajunii]|uniref:uncharacterized protein n=1 Tax=Ordospora pajunii TaxID=3039483 RepID=UPI0029527D56|nr:uncharacterized protein HK407_08g12800 [Ordospora pajunii]KAH9411135.1 hypothetical protein HK407_08g12800 [Ordospora pajunii]
MHTEDCHVGIAGTADELPEHGDGGFERLLPVEFYMNLRMRDDRGAESWSSAFMQGEKRVSGEQPGCTASFLRMLSEIEEGSLGLENEVCRLLDREKRIEQENEILRAFLHEAVEKL